MKIGMISDLHLDLNEFEGDSPESALKQITKEKSLDLLIVAGDISNDYKITLEFVKRFVQDTGIPLYFVPGNHDLWKREDDSMTTHDILKEYNKCKYNIGNGTVHLNNEWVIVGDTGWYDYSFGNHGRFSEADFAKGFYQGRQWKDMQYINWGTSDIEQHQVYLEQFIDHLEQVKGKNIIFVTHMVMHEKLIVPTENRLEWNYFNAFLGSKAYKALAFSYQVKYAVFGHVHFRQIFKEEETTFICSCLNYRNEWLGSKKAYDQVMEALQMIEI